MTIAIPAALAVTDALDLLQPKMQANPVGNALANTNWLWRHHAPPLIDVCPSRSSTSSAVTQRFVTPCIPDRAALNYRLQALIEIYGAATVGIEVEYATTWVSLAGTSWTSLGTFSSSAGGAGVVTRAIVATVPYAAVALRWIITVSTGNYVTHHLLAIPEDDTIDATPGLRDGFVPYDTGLLDAADPPMNTEMLNRVTGNVTRLNQRVQAALSFVQPESSTYGQAPEGVTEGHVVAVARIWLGARTKALLQIQCIAGVSSGTATDVVRIRQIALDGSSIGDGVETTLDADGAIHEAVIDLVAQGGGMMHYADVRLRLQPVGNTATLYSLHGWTYAP